MQSLNQPLYVDFLAQNVIKNLQPPWVAYIIKYIFTVGPFSSLSRAFARISSRIPACLCRAAQCGDAFKAEVSLDVGSGSVIRLSKCAKLSYGLSLTWTKTGPKVALIFVSKKYTFCRTLPLLVFSAFCLLFLISRLRLFFDRISPMPDARLTNMLRGSRLCPRIRSLSYTVEKVPL